MSATIFRYSRASIGWLYTCSGIFTRSCTYTGGSGSCVVLPEMLMLMSNSSLDGGQILCGFDVPLDYQLLVRVGMGEAI